MSTNINTDIAKLIDKWCGRRAITPLRIVLPHWPPANGFTDEWMAVWAAMRHTRAMCRDDLAKHQETEALDHIIAALSDRLHPADSPQGLELRASQLIEAIFGKQDA